MENNGASCFYLILPFIVHTVAPIKEEHLQIKNMLAWNCHICQDNLADLIRLAKIHDTLWRAGGKRWNFEQEQAVYLFATVKLGGFHMVITVVMIESRSFSKARL